MVRMPLTITPEEIATLAKSPRDGESSSIDKNPDQYVHLSPMRETLKSKGDSSPSPSPESEKKGNKRKRPDHYAAEVGSIMEDMRQASSGLQDGATGTPQRPLGEGEAAFLSLVLQAANSEPIDEVTNEPAPSLPDQLLESFIVRAHAMKDSTSTSPEDGQQGCSMVMGKKRPVNVEESDLDMMPHDDAINVQLPRRGGLSALSREGSWSDDEYDAVDLRSGRTAGLESDRLDLMPDANPSSSKRRPGRPPLAARAEPGRAMTTTTATGHRRSIRSKDDGGDRRHEDWGKGEQAGAAVTTTVRRPPGRRGPGRPPKKPKVGGGEELLFSFNEESDEGERRDERGRGAGGRGFIGTLHHHEEEEEEENEDEEEDQGVLVAANERRTTRRAATGVQTRRSSSELEASDDNVARMTIGRDEEGEQEGDEDEDDAAAEAVDGWNSELEDDEDEDEEEEDDDEEDESWVDGEASSEAEPEAAPEDGAAAPASSEEMRASTNVLRREQEDLRRAIAASVALARATGTLPSAPTTTSSSTTTTTTTAAAAAAATMAMMDGSPSDASAAEPENSIKLEPWVPSSAELPLAFRRLRPPWLDAYQTFRARGVSAEEQRAEIERMWQAFLATADAESRAWVKVPSTVVTWEDLVAHVHERVREAQAAEDLARQDRRTRWQEELARRLKEEQAAAEEEKEQDEDGEDDKEEGEEHDGGGASDEEGESDDGNAEEENEDDDDDAPNSARRKRSLYQRRTRSRAGATSESGGGNKKKKRDMVAQLLDCFKEKELEKVLVVNAAARKRKPPRKYGIDEWFNRRG